MGVRRLERIAYFYEAVCGLKPDNSRALARALFCRELERKREEECTLGSSASVSPSP